MRSPGNDRIAAMPAQPLPTAVLKDVCTHAADKIARTLADSLQLVEHPKQRAVLAEAMAGAVVASTVELVQDAFEKDTGKTISNEAALGAVLKYCWEYAQEK
jgi:hypothetical protein